jgi:hypothetical protein
VPLLFRFMWLRRLMLPAGAVDCPQLLPVRGWANPCEASSLQHELSCYSSPWSYAALANQLDGCEPHGALGCAFMWGGWVGTG